MSKVLDTVNRTISTYLINKAGFKVSQAHIGVMTLIRCGDIDPALCFGVEPEPAFSCAIH